MKNFGKISSYDAESDLGEITDEEGHVFGFDASQLLDTLRPIEIGREVKFEIITVAFFSEPIATNIEPF